METKEFVGATLEEAKEKARDYFNSNHIEYELLPPKLLKVITGKRDVRIKASKKEISQDVIAFKDKIKNFLENLISKSCLNLEVKEELKDDTIKYDLSGEDMALVLENRGAILESLQHLVLKYASKTDQSFNIVIDSDNFKEERESFIKSYVKKACENVRKNGQEYIMRPLNPAERRMVHMLVKEQGDLTTESLGEGKYKKVKIFKL